MVGRWPVEADRSQLRSRALLRGRRAVDAVGNIERVHVGRWGDGSEHLHLGFMGRPARMP